MLLTSVNDIDARLEGTKTTGATLNLEDYRGKMGTGTVDAYQLLMQIEGTPCLKVFDRQAGAHHPHAALRRIGPEPDLPGRGDRQGGHGEARHDGGA